VDHLNLKVETLLSSETSAVGMTKYIEDFKLCRVPVLCEDNPINASCENIAVYSEILTRDISTLLVKMQ